MSGHIFKNFYLCKGNVIFMAVMQAIISAAIIVISILGGDTSGEEYTMISSLCYFLIFFMAGISNTEYFKCDEQPTWVGFVASTPLAGKGQVAGKYYTILILNTAILFCNFITDIIATAILGSTSYYMGGVLMILFSIELIVCAFEMVFYIRYGSSVGSAVKGIVFGAFIAIIMVYFLFGDISFIFSDDPIADLMKFLEGPVPMWIMAVLPFAAVGLYAASYALSLKLYRKGAENYGE
ncbi:MAG: ABC-2 transporter permease [Oscillospiraceae bacterium]